MRSRLSALTCILHIPIFFMLVGLAESAGSALIPYPYAYAAAAVVLLLVPAPAVIERAMDDRRRSWWSARLLSPTYFAHFCSALGMFFPALIFGLGRFIWDAAHGRWEIPTRTLVGCYLAALALSLWGVFIRRHWLLTHETRVPIESLPSAFDGYRIAHLSDLHIGSLTSQATIDAWVERTNAAAPDLVVLTGDYVTNGTVFHEDIARALGRLKARDGVYASMGNHDYFGEGEPLLGLLDAVGVSVLRNRGVLVERDTHSMYIAGVDDTWTKRDDLALALRDRPDGTTTVLLAHDPSTFVEASRAGVDLTLSGHTHGGQVAVPFLARALSLSHLAHRFHLGIYREGRSTLYVHPGLGTTGIPIRLGVAPAIAIHRLVAA
ncbi:MAG: metallophosphoesterase [Polyangiaceae bacterium]